jgi:hypothetical protein
MSQPGEDRDLELFLDAATADLPEPALLARYVRDPASLSAEERNQVERAALEQPLVADELHSLRSFDFSALAQVTAEVRAERRRSRWERIRERLTLGTGVWIAGAAAAALIAALYLPISTARRASIPRPGDQRVAQVPPAPRPEPVNPRPPAEVHVPSPEPAPQLPSEAAPVKPDEPETVVVRPQRPPPPEPDRPRDRDVPAVRPAPEEVPEPILVAMVMPEYDRPLDAETRFGVSPTVRGDDSARTVSLQTLSPSHVARTSHGQPDLFWYVAPLPKGGTFELVIEPSGDAPALVETGLPLPREPGLQRIRLSELGVELPLDRELRWSVSHYPSADEPPRSFALGWIRRVAPPRELSARVEQAASGEIPALYAGAGFWYDALESVRDLADRRPGDAQVEEAYRSLLVQGGLDKIVQ